MKARSSPRSASDRKADVRRRRCRGTAVGTPVVVTRGGATAHTSATRGRDWSQAASARHDRRDATARAAPVPARGGPRRLRRGVRRRGGHAVRRHRTDAHAQRDPRAAGDRSSATGTTTGSGCGRSTSTGRSRASAGSPSPRSSRRSCRPSSAAGGWGARGGAAAWPRRPRGRRSAGAGPSSACGASSRSSRRATRAASGWPRSSGCGAGATACTPGRGRRVHVYEREPAVRERAATPGRRARLRRADRGRLRVLPRVPAGRVGAAGRRGGDRPQRAAPRAARRRGPGWRSTAATPAGCVLFEPAPGLPGVAHLANLFVDPAWWGTGLAARLHGRAVAAMRERGYRTGRLFTPEAQARARRFYEREGWRAAGPPRWEELLGLSLVRVPHRARRGLDWESAGPLGTTGFDVVDFAGVVASRGSGGLVKPRKPHTCGLSRVRPRRLATS